MIGCCPGSRCGPVKSSTRRGSLSAASCKMTGILLLILVSLEAPIWATNTAGQPVTQATMQADGNFVLYAGVTPVWASGTAGNSGAYLVVQNDGELMVFSSSNGVAQRAAVAALLLDAQREPGVAESGADPAEVGTGTGERRRERLSISPPTADRIARARAPQLDGHRHHEEQAERSESAGEQAGRRGPPPAALPCRGSSVTIAQSKSVASVYRGRANTVDGASAEPDRPAGQCRIAEVAPHQDQEGGHRPEGAEVGEQDECGAHPDAGHPAEDAGREGDTGKKRTD